LTAVEFEFVRLDGSSLTVEATVAVERSLDNAVACYLIVATEGSAGQQADQVLLGGVHGVPGWGKGDYFQRLAGHLTTTLSARFALVTECTDPSLTRVRTLAYMDHQNLLKNIEYDLANTPCAGVIAGSIRYYPDKLSAQFKMDLGEESYLGAPLWSAQGQVLGHLALLDDKPMCYNTWEMTLVQNFALQAGLVLENRQLHRQLLVLACEPEHRQVARKLHDSVIQSLFSLTLLTAGWQRLLRTGQPVDPDSWLTELGALSQQALHELRLLTTELPSFTLTNTSRNPAEKEKLS
jgi:signal transduction histidine kinase